jgi:hypothetical protein
MTIEVPNTFRSRVARRLAGKYWPNPTRTTVVGLAPEHESLSWAYQIPDVGGTRMDIYRDMERMDSTMPEVSRALDIISDNAVNARDGTKRSFTIRYDEGVFISRGKQAVIESCIKRTQLESKIEVFVREPLKYGDCFIQNIIDADYHVARLMFMNPFSMRRNEDKHGLLMMGSKPGEWAYEQVEPDGGRFIAGFYPFQVQHVRWGRSGMSKYGSPMMETARYPFKKLQAMEEALVINWLTRAFARLKFQVDTTGLPQKEAMQKVREMKDAVTRRTASTNYEGAHRLSTVQDLFIGNGYTNQGGRWEKSLNDVSVIDTSNTGFWNIAAVEYWRTKLVTATGVPKAHLGIEQDINAKATLQWQDERFAKTIRRVQMMGSEIIHNTINLELMLQGIDPLTVPYVVEWPSPSMQDETERADVYNALGMAATNIITNEIMTPDQVREKLFRMTPAQRDAAQAYYDKMRRAVPESQANAN